MHKLAIEAKATMATTNSNGGVKIMYWGVKEKRNKDERGGSIDREAKGVKIEGDQKVGDRR